MGMLRQTKASKQKTDHVLRVKVARNRVSDYGRVCVVWCGVVWRLCQS